MLKLRRVLKITLSLIILFVIGYFIYTFYQKRAIVKGVVHMEAESVLKIGIHDIKRTLLVDLISSPGYYWNNVKISQSKKDKDSVETDGKGIDLEPYSMVFYTMKNQQNTYFSTLKIDDSEAFEIYILDYLKKKNSSIENAQYKYAIDKKSKLVFAWTSNKLAIALSLDPSFEKCKPVFDDVLLNDKLIYDTNNSYLKRLISSDSHITYLKEDNEMTINFLDGKAIISGLWHTSTPNKFKSQIQYTAIPDASLLFYLDANFQNEENREWVSTFLDGISFFEKNNLNSVSLTDQMNGVISLSIKDATMQSDTIITYEYDDNFEKVATKSLQEKRAPVVVLSVGAHRGLNSYLIEQGALENNILKAIPYYTFYAQEDSLNSVFSTVKHNQTLESKTGSYFFNLDVDFENLQKDLEIPKGEKVSTLLESLRISARQESKDTFILKGKLLGKTPHINIISQLFFGLQEQDSIR